MKELGTLNISLFDDRGVKKVRVNVIGPHRIYGFLSPTEFKRKKPKKPSFD